VEFFALSVASLGCSMFGRSWWC